MIRTTKVNFQVTYKEYFTFFNKFNICFTYEKIGTFAYVICYKLD